MSLAIWLIISIATSQPDYAVELSPAELGRCPTVSEVPADMPRALRAPLDGRFVTEAGDHRAGTFLPQPLDLHILRRLRMLDRYPAICQAHVDQVIEVAETDRDTSIAVDRARCIVERVETEIAADPGHPTWFVVLMTVGVGIAAVVAGYGLGQLR